MAPALEPKLMDAVEKLDYRVTIGDVASQAGLDVNVAEKGLLALASETGGNFQVGETGDIVYVFPKNFQAILRSKYLRLRLSEAGTKAWRIMFYLIRLSVGVVLILLIVAIVVAIVAAVIAVMTASKSSDDNRGGGSSRSSGGGIPGINLFYFPDFGRIFYPNYHRRYDRHRDRSTPQHRNYSPQTRTTNRSDDSDVGFIEVFFSFLFGDDVPNLDIEERRWQAIATTIRNNGGAVTAEMIAPYIDDLGNEESRQAESYMVPVVARFDGKPEFTDDDDLIYLFPQMQATATESKPKAVQAYLKEDLWRFSRASSGQLVMAGGFGIALMVLSFVLLGLIQEPAVRQMSSYWLISVLPGIGILYSALYLTIPAIRYAWLQWRNKLIESRNQNRQNRAAVLNQPTNKMQKKMAAAKTFAANILLGQDKVVYTTEDDLLSQDSPWLPGSTDRQG